MRIFRPSSPFFCRFHLFSKESLIQSFLLPWQEQRWEHNPHEWVETGCPSNVFFVFGIHFCVVLVFPSLMAPIGGVCLGKPEPQMHNPFTCTHSALHLGVSPRSSGGLCTRINFFGLKALPLPSIAFKLHDHAKFLLWFCFIFGLQNTYHLLGGSAPLYGFPRQTAHMG